MNYRELLDDEIEDMLDGSDNTDGFSFEELKTLQKLGFTIAAFSGRPDIFVFYEYEDGSCINAYRRNGGEQCRLSFYYNKNDMVSRFARNTKLFITFEELLDYLKG